MDIGNIENYSFIHGLHRNMVNGKWFPLHPHTLGRPLTHPEMDYNLLYSQQTLAGWRIFGQNDDLTLADNELEKSLIFWKISISDTDYDRYVAAGYSSGQYIWITPQYDCNDFYVNFASKTDAIDNCGGFIITLASTTNATQVPDPTATLMPTSTPIQPTPTAYSSGSGSGSGGGAGLPTATPIQPTPTNGAGIPDPTATPDESIRPTPTATLDESIRPTPTPTDGAGIPDPTATPIIDPTATTAPDPTATPVIDERLNYEFMVCFNPGGKAQPVYICTADTLLAAGFTSIPPTNEDTITIDGELNVDAVYIFGRVTPSTDINPERILTYNIFACDGTRKRELIVERPTATPVPNPTSTPIQPTPTTISSGSGAGVPTATPVPNPTATTIPAPTATETIISSGGGAGLPTATPIQPTPTEFSSGGGAGLPTATPVPNPTSTDIPRPTALPIIDPTSTPVPDPTAQPVPDPTSTDVPRPTDLPDSSGNAPTPNFKEPTATPFDDTPNPTPRDFICSEYMLSGEIPMDCVYLNCDGLEERAVYIEGNPVTFCATEIISFSGFESPMLTGGTCK